MVSVTLTKPLTTHKGAVSTLELSEPTAKSFVTAGEPFKVRVKDDAISIDYDNRAMMAFLADMTGVDTLLLESLSAKDYVALRTKATNVIMGLAGSEDPLG